MSALFALPLNGGAQEMSGDGDAKISLRLEQAIANGDLNEAWNQFIIHLVDAHAAGNVADQLILLDRGIEICLMMNFPHLADQLYMRAKSLGLLKDPEWRLHGFLLKAHIQFAFGNYKQTRLLLEKAAGFVNANTKPADLTLLFAQRALDGWLTHQYSAANEYIEAVEFNRADETTARARGIARMTLSLMLQEREHDKGLIGSNLELSKNAYLQYGYPIAFYADLSRVLSLHPGILIRSIDRRFLEYAKDGDRYPNSWIASVALTARAELMRRDGNLSEAVDLLQRADAMVRLTHEENENLGMEWRLIGRDMLDVPPPIQQMRFPVQWVIVTMLLVLFMLVLLLRIHTQRILNQKLLESVESSRIAEQAAEHASRLKSQFVSNVSHEIKTPMNGLVGMTSLLEELVKDPLQKKYLSTIRQCSTNLLVLMNDLLDLGRIDANKLEIDKRPFDAREIFTYCENIVRLRAEEKGITLNVIIDKQIPETIVSDSTRLSQIVVNLLNNAIKFTAEGSVSLHAVFKRSIAGSGNLIVVVSDTGTGIEADRLHTVFEPFNQKSPNADAIESGSGLGLAICKRLTDHMGGTLDVESQYGSGSRFTLSLPVHIPAPKVISS